MTGSLHQCARGRRCPGRDDSGGGAAITAPVGLCQACLRQLARELAGLPELYARLETIMGEHRRGGEKVSGTRDAPIPPRVDVLAMQADLDAAVSTWAPIVARRARVTWDVRRMAHTRAGYRLTRGARFLAVHGDVLVGLPVAEIHAWVPGYGMLLTRRSGLDGALDLVALAERGRRLATGGDGHARLPVPCPSCEAPALMRRNGGDQVECGSCGRCWPESDYRRLCLVLAEDYGQHSAA